MKFKESEVRLRAIIGESIIDPEKSLRFEARQIRALQLTPR